MSEPVCQDDWEAYRLFGTPDDFTLDAFAEDVNYGMSPGLIAWRAIAFALERRVDLPLWVRQYLAQTAAGIENWAMLNGHPAELKDVLALNGQRKPKDDRNDPRWIYDAICQLREHDPKASVASLVRECMKQFPQVGAEEEYVRQKYYQGKRLEVDLIPREFAQDVFAGAREEANLPARAPDRVLDAFNIGPHVGPIEFAIHLASVLLRRIGQRWDRGDDSVNLAGETGDSADYGVSAEGGVRGFQLQGVQVRVDAAGWQFVDAHILPLGEVQIERTPIFFGGVQTHRILARRTLCRAVRDVFFERLAQRRQGRLGVAIDCATRCVVGLCLCRSPTSTAAVRTIELATTDKTAIASEFGCLHGWSQGGLPEMIVADQGSAFVSEEFKMMTGGLRARLVNPPAGVPNPPSLRPAVEHLWQC